MGRTRTHRSSRTYYLGINSSLIIIHKSRGFSMPSWFNELSFSAGKKTYEGYSIGDRIRLEDVPKQVIMKIKYPNRETL